MGNEKTRFKKGTSGNPNGRPRVPVEILEMRKLNQIELERILNKCAFLTLPEIESLSSKENINTPIFEMVVAKILHNAFKSGNIWGAEFILNRLIGRVVDSNKMPPPETPPPGLASNQVAKIEIPKKTFEQFCIDAKYHKPFDKQIEMAEFFDLEVTRLLLGSRGYGKTDMVTIMRTAYKVYCDYIDHLNTGSALRETHLIITKTGPRSKAIVKEISDALKANQVPLEVDNAYALRVQGLVGQNHSVEGITIKTSMRGRHPYQITMDDPVTDEDVSKAMRTLVERKYNEAMKLTKNILVIGQPAHAFDLYAKLRGIIQKMEVPHGTIPELDHDLEAMILAGVDPTSIEMSYHLRIPETGVMPFAKIQYIPDMIPGEGIAFLDPSEGGDYTALSIVKGYMAGVAVQGHAWKKAWYHCLDALVPILKARGVKKLIFETNKHGDQPIDQLRGLLKPLGIGVVGSYSDTNKHAAIMSAGSMSHQIFLSRTSDKVYTDQVIQYEYGVDFDDSPDSLARCLEKIGLIKVLKGKGS